LNDYNEEYLIEKQAKLISSSVHCDAESDISSTTILSARHQKRVQAPAIVLPSNFCPLHLQRAS
jgi:hypothetical protein